MSRRAQALDAALDLLGEAGIRALTHGAVDRRGGLPPGTTSNYFRTRDALLAGALDHLAERELGLIAALRTGREHTESIDSLVDEASSMVAFLLGPGRTQSLARHAIFLEAAWRPELRPRLLDATAPFWDLLSERLTRLGASAPGTAARTLLACIDGLITDQLIRPEQDFDARAVLAPLVTALVGSRPEPLEHRRQERGGAATADGRPRQLSG